MGKLPKCTVFMNNENKKIYKDTCKTDKSILFMFSIF